MKILYILIFILISFNANCQENLDVNYTYKSNGLAKIVKKDYAGAIVDFTQYINRSQPLKYKYAYLETIHLRAHCKSMLEDFRGAIIDYELIISKCHQLNFINSEIYSSAYYYMGICKYSLRRADEACKDLSKAGELGYSKSYAMIKEVCN